MSVVPDFPTNIQATAKAASAIVSWGTPESDGGSEITGYRIVSIPDNRKPLLVGPSVYTSTMTSLTNGTFYNFTVYAINSVGSSGISPSTTPYPLPGVPVLIATVSNNTVNLSWTAKPAHPTNSPITGYNITCSDSNVVIPSVSGGNSGSCTITDGLTNGTPITFTISSVSLIGESAGASKTVTPATLPDAVSTFTCIAKPISAILNWTEPSYNGGSAITGYVINYNTTSTINVSAVLRTRTITGLTNGTPVEFNIVAKNILGTGSNTSQTVTPYALPGVPVLTATAGDTQVVLSWTATPADANSPITGYILNYSGSDYPVASSPRTITELTNGTPVVFKLKSVSAIGESAFASKPATPAAVPGAVGTFTSVPKVASVILNWTAPATTGGAVITGYTITYGSTSLPIAATLRTRTITGLTNGTTYQFNIVARNIMGAGANTSQTETPYALPGVPVVTATPGDSQVTLTWTATPADANSPITDYIVTYGGNNYTGATSPYTISGLTNGTPFSYSVKSVSAIGTSTGLVKSVIPNILPNAVGSFTVTRGAASAILSWTAPTANSGTAVTGYVITYGNITLPIAANILTRTVTGLLNGTSYTFNIVAKNIMGSGTPTSQSVTPAAVPAAPRPTAVAGTGQVTLSWVTPASNGSALTSYNISYGTTPTVVNVSSELNTRIITGLTARTSYTFSMTAVNGVGSSLPGTVRINSN